jgi:prepilin-type N-terminal cleavage/methylation domain-containing protein
MSYLRRHKAGRNLVTLLRDRRGFTLPEVIVVMAIFIIVIGITSAGFQTVLRQASQQTKQVETEIGNIVGLELFRSDLQNAGYGLPWALQATPAFTEVADGEATMASDWWPTGKSPTSFNDTPASSSAGVPRAVQNLTTNFNKDDSVTPATGSQYLVLKSLTAAPGDTPKKWSTVTFGGAGKAATVWDPNGPRAFKAGERVIVIRNTFDGDIPKRELAVTKATGVFSSTFANYSTLTLPHSVGGDPALITDVFQVYGVDPGSDLRMPFNRADYYVSTPPGNMPASCAPNTGILYKAVASQSSGFTKIPLLDCVADMQVAYGLGPAGSAEINNHDSMLRGSGSGGMATAKEIRDQLKEIRVYILAHEGKKDLSFTYPSETIRVGESFGGPVIGRDFNLKNRISGDWSHYRWKVYTIVVHPKNLIQ